jgi:hypothetical protein
MNGTRDICIELYIVVLDKQRDVHTNSMVNDVINFINRRGVRDTTLCVKFVVEQQLLFIWKHSSLKKN